MGLNKSKIEWTDYTWNPITGCLNDCEYCYAKKIATRFAGGNAFPKGFEPAFHPERLADHFPQKPSKIFTCSMGELFGDWIPKWQVQDVFDTIRHYPEHAFQLLTKQPQNLIKWSPFPDNCWAGVSATNKLQFLSGMHYMADVRAPVKFVSFEPLLESVESSSPIGEHLMNGGINWVIIGRQTPLSAKTQPHITDIQRIIFAANEIPIPVFLKDNLKGFLPFKQYGDPWKEVYKLRQEYPICRNSKRES